MCYEHALCLTCLINAFWNSLLCVMKDNQGGTGERKCPSPVTRELVTVTPYVSPNPGPYPQVGDVLFGEGGVAQP